MIEKEGGVKMKCFRHAKKKKIDCIDSIFFWHFLNAPNSFRPPNIYVFVHVQVTSIFKKGVRQLDFFFGGGRGGGGWWIEYGWGRTVDNYRFDEFDNGESCSGFSCHDSLD